MKASILARWHETWGIACVCRKTNPKEPWDYNHNLYKQRNEVEPLFRRLKAYGRIFTPYDKLDLVFGAFIFFALFLVSLP